VGFFKDLFIYLRERERAREQGEEHSGRGRESPQSDSPVSMEQDMGLDTRTLRS